MILTGKSFLFSTILLTLSAIPVFSQKGAGPVTPAPTTGGGNVGNTPTTPTPGLPTPGSRTRSPFPSTDTMPQMERPIYISGKVMLDDGTAPAESITIERVCNGSPRPVAYTTSKGRFSFEFHHPQGVMPDASTSSMGASTGDFGGMGTSSRTMGGGGRFDSGEREMMGCELRASLPGFRSDTINLAGHRMFDNPEVGTIILHRLGNVQGTTISVTSLQAPNDAKKALEKGREALRKSKTDEAEKQFQKAVDSYPKYAAAWYELGRLQAARKDEEGARKSFEQAVAADPKFVSPFLDLAMMSVRKSDWKDTAAYTEKVVKLNPVNFPQAFYYNSVANYYLKNWDTAEKSAREAQKLDAQHRMPKIEQVLGAILAEKKDFAGAAEQMREYLKIDPAAKDAEMVKKQLAELEQMLVAQKEK